MYVLGTAGHVDHGKSTLVCALTGIDPDRLPEEKARQMTIDLGFAWFKLPSGKEVSIVDVPGHERFVRTMISGAVGIDAALLVIAADRGVMQQTREHLAILNLLQVTKGIVVITKKDLVDPEGLELAKMEAEEVIKDSCLKNAQVVAVSAEKREGLTELAAAIDKLLETTPQRPDIGKPRLAIDRIFTIKGFGTVVTGTLVDGKLHVGQEVEILPLGLKAQIRRLETHKQKLDEAVPGSRVAANLAGIPPEKLERGMVITTPGWLKPTEVIDVRLQTVSDLSHEITYNMEVTFYSGTSEVGAKVRLLDKEKLKANEEGWAQLRLDREVVVAKGDFFIIRYPEGTLGGGEIVDTHPKRHRRFQTSVIESLESRKEGTPQDIVLATLESSSPSEFEKLSRDCHIDQSECVNAVKELIQEKQVIAVGAQGAHQLIFSKNQWEKLVKDTLAYLQSYHSEYPLRRGMPREELKSRLKVASSHFDNLTKKLAEENAIIEAGTAVSLTSHKIILSPAQQVQANAFLKAVSEGHFSPPEVPIDPELLAVLIQEGKVVKVGDGVVFSTTAYNEMVKQIKDYIKSHGKITVAEARDLLQNSRKHAVPFMEYLDEQKITRRLGNERVLR